MQLRMYAGILLCLSTGFVQASLMVINDTTAPITFRIVGAGGDCRGEPTTVSPRQQIPMCGNGVPKSRFHIDISNEWPGNYPILPSYRDDIHTDWGSGKFGFSYEDLLVGSGTDNTLTFKWDSQNALPRLYYNGTKVWTRKEKESGSWKKH